MTLSLTDSNNVASGLSLTKADELKALPERVSVRASQYDFAMGESSPGYGAILANLQSGYEDQLKEFMARDKANREAKARMQVANDLVSGRQGPLTEDEMLLMMSLRDYEVGGDERIAQMQEDIFESEYGRQFIAANLALDDDEIYEEAVQEDPVAANDVIDRAEWAVARNTYTNELLDELEARKESQGILSKGWDFVEQVVPFIDYMQMRNLVNEAPASSLLIGRNLEEQITYLHTLPPAEFKRQLKAAYDEIAEKNLFQAERFLNAVQFYPRSQMAADSILGVLDVVDIATLGAGVALKGGKAAARGAKVQRLGTRLKGAVAASTLRVPGVKQIAQIGGNVRVAAQAAAMKVLQRKLSNQPVRDITEALDAVPSISNPRAWTTSFPPNLGADVQARVMARAEHGAGIIEEFLTSPDLVTRTVRERMEIMGQKIVDDVMNELSVRSRSILNISANRGLMTARGPVPYKQTLAEESFTNTESVSILVGTGKGTPFATQTVAEVQAKKLFPEIETKIVPTPNGGYAIEITRDLPETLDNFKGMAIPTGSKYEPSFINAMIGMARTPKDVLPVQNTMARQAVTHGSQLHYGLYRELAEPLSVLGKDEWKQLEEILIQNRDFIDPFTGERGMFYKTQFDFEEAFQRKHGVFPTEKQVSAYYAYVQLNELDLMVRWAGWYRDKVTAGWRQYNLKTTIGVKMGKGQTADIPVDLSFEGKDVTDNFVDGILTNVNLPDVNIAIVDAKKGDMVIVNKNKFLQDKKVDEIRNKIKTEGYRVVQSADANIELPGNMKEHHVAFLVTNSIDEKRISLKATQNRGGGHIINAFPAYLKQAKVTATGSGRHYITGDVAIAGARTLKDAQRVAGLWDEARVMMVKNDPNLDAFVQKNLGMTGKEFVQHFKKRKNHKGEIVEGLNPNAKIVATMKGQRATDAYKYDNDFQNLVDTSNSPYNLRTALDRSFAGERGSSNMHVYLEESNPLIVDTAGDILDPLEMLEVSSKNMFDIRMKRDYMMYSAKEWVENFADDLDVPRDELYRNPVKYLYEPTFKKGADMQRVRVAKTAQRQILRFMGHYGREERALEYLKAKTAEIAYERFGKKGLDVAEDYLIPTLDDPARAMRSIAFNAKLGLFNPATFLVNIQTLSNILAISPTAALKGFPAGMAARFASFPSVRNAMKQFAVANGWKPEHWDEMMEALTQTSGWDRIGGSTALLDDLSSPAMMRGKVDKFLDAGRVFFDQSEKLVRSVGYTTAYQEWRRANPTKVYDRAAREWVRNRADTLTVDMSNANNASWQKGIFAVPAQFLSYQIRFTEQMVGKRLTTAEKMRVLGVHSALYGLPVAVGGVVGVFPFGEYMKNVLMSNGVQYDDTTLEAVIRGLPAVMMEFAGYDVDYGARFGTGGISIIRDLWRGDKSFAEIAMGASGSMFTDIFAQMVTGGEGFLAGLGDDPNNPIVPLDGSSVFRMLQNITTVNSTYRLIYALNTQKWISKNGVVIDEVTGAEALLNTLTGATLQRQSDMYTQLEVMKDIKDAKASAIEKVRAAYRKADLEDDPDMMRQYLQEAKMWAIAGGLSPQEWSRVRREALRAHSETMLESIMKRYERLQQQREMREELRGKIQP